MWRLVWSDEFSQADGSPPDPVKWNYDVGGGGWGNNELQTYTTRTNNCRIEGGQLVIEVRKETFTGPDSISRNYTSTRLKTQGKWSWAYGRIEARVKVPRGNGLWPAFWMLGDNFSSVGWPACGEIDILENIGREPRIVHGTIHGPGYSGGNGIGKSYTLPGGVAVADDFHVFAIEWQTNQIRWFVDGQPFFTVTPASLPSGARWVFDHPSFLILNAAVGGNWPGSPDGSTVFPQRLLVDYVRVYAPAAVADCGGNVLPPPVIENISPDGTVPFANPSDQLSFNLRSPCAGVASNGVQMLLNGVDVSAQLLMAGGASNRSVTFSGLTSNLEYSVWVRVTDVNGLSSTAAWQFDTFSQDNFMWEAEDFDFGGGQFLDHPGPSSTQKTDSYFGRVGQSNVDRRETSFDGDRLYRPGDGMATLVADDFLRPKFLAAINAGDTDVKDYKIGYFYAGEWVNHTRTFPQGTFHVYGRLAGGAGDTGLYLDRVTAGRGTTSQTTTRLGSFAFAGRGWQAFDFVPLRDASGLEVALALDGLATLRATTTGGNDPNYFMLVPTGLPVPVTAGRTGGEVRLAFPTHAGVEYLVLYKNELADARWQVLDAVLGNGGMGSVALALSGNRRFLRVTRK